MSDDEYCPTVSGDSATESYADSATESYATESDNNTSESAEPADETMPGVNVTIAISEVLQLERNYRGAEEQSSRLRDTCREQEDANNYMCGAMHELRRKRDELQKQVHALTKDCDDIERDRDEVIADRDKIHEEYLEAEQSCAAAYAENDACQALLTGKRIKNSACSLHPRETLQIPTDRKRAREVTAERDRLDRMRRDIHQKQRHDVDEIFAAGDRGQGELNVLKVEYVRQYNAACDKYNV